MTQPVKVKESDTQNIKENIRYCGYFTFFIFIYEFFKICHHILLFLFKFLAQITEVDDSNNKANEYRAYDI